MCLTFGSSIIYCILILIGIILFLWAILAHVVLFKHNSKKRLKDLETNIAISLAEGLNATNVKNKVNYDWVKPYLNTNEGLWLFTTVLIKMLAFIDKTKQEAVSAFSYEIGLSTIIEQKLYSTNWYEIVMAIRSSHELGLKENLAKISSFSNHKNEMVRRESEIAMTVFLGWESLLLFAESKYTMGRWQQISIIKKLIKHHPNVEIEHLNYAISSSNRHITELLLRIIGNFKLNSHKSFVLKHLESCNKTLSECSYNVLVNLGTNSFDTWVKLCKIDSSKLPSNKKESITIG